MKKEEAREKEEQSRSGTIDVRGSRPSQLQMTNLCRVWPPRGSREAIANCQP